MNWVFSHFYITENLHHDFFGEFAMNMIYGWTAIVSAAVAITDPTVGTIPVVQYGALGLCGFMVYFLCKHITDLHKDHRLERQKLTDATLEISNKAIEGFSEVTAQVREQTIELQKRTCFVERYDMIEKLERLAILDKESKKN